MQLTTLAVLFASLSAVCLAVPANNNQETRTTYLITCIGNNPCTDNISRTKPGGPEPTTDKMTTTTRKPPRPTTTKTTTKRPDQPTKTTTGEEVGPSSTRCPVPLYYQCGGYYDGKPWSGCSNCVQGAKCLVQNEYYHQCVSE
ncbi:hypothetical protein BDW02DRAFT_598102 [Decorospora gaudefroyi]|uniref:CBM1 domain-containing protein n=1 Tax=Decorospora gaudefroyi TaxID=184978 RepID=A0A6A5KB62_9PLEO|nr:hypothetical protein BDW02DRAFT_598102 [Decorospora gaudefroyi]